MGFWTCALGVFETTSVDYERLAQKLVKKHGRFRVTKTCSVAAIGTAQSGSWVGSTM